MSRYKTFDATGIAPGGRIFAGDLNAIQDRYADLANFGQTHDVGTLRIGDTGLAITKFGTGEIQVAAHIRSTGMLRPQKGITYPSFTTTTRNSIPAGEAPAGTVIWNTTTVQLEVNAGTDGSRNWVPASAQANAALFTGMMLPYPGDLDHTQTGIVEPKPGWLFCNGASLLRAGTYAALFSELSTAYGSADGTHFNIPDTRNGRDPIGKGTGFATRGATGGEENHILSVGEIPSHSHGHLHTGTTDPPSLNGPVGPTGGNNSTNTSGGNLNSQAHTHTFTTSFDATVAGGGGGHTNRSPYVVVGGHIIRYL